MNGTMRYTLINGFFSLFFMTSSHFLHDLLPEDSGRLYKKHEVSNPIYYKPDMTLKRRVYVLLYSLNQIRKFNTYCK